MQQGLKVKMESYMKKILAILICSVMIISAASAVSAQETQDSAEQFYQALEEIITAADAQGDQENADDGRPEGFPALSEPAFLYRAGEAVFDLDGQEINAENGIILQMIDDDTVVTEGEDPDILLDETAGFLKNAYKDTVIYELTADTEVDPEKTYYLPAPDTEEEYAAVEAPTEEGLSAYYERSTGNCSVQLNITHGEYYGNIYNATGYYDQAPDYLEVNIAAGAVLNGDIALSSCVHGMLTGGLDLEEIINALENRKAQHETAQETPEADTSQDEVPAAQSIEDLEYVFIDENGEVTLDKEAAIALQFTKIYTGETFLLGKVVNLLNYNGAAKADVNVQGSWYVQSASLITGLNIEEGGLVYGEIIELADGSMLIIPSEEPMEPGQYPAAPESEAE